MLLCGLRLWLWLWLWLGALRECSHHRREDVAQVRCLLLLLWLLVRLLWLRQLLHERANRLH